MTLKHQKNLVFALTTLILVSWVAMDVYRSTFGLRVNETTFKSGQYLEAPLRIFFVSDLHITNSKSDFDRLNHIIGEASRFGPDIILLGGDFTGESSAGTQLIRDELLEVLARFTRISPTYTVLGNHEWWTSLHWSSWLKSVGINVIENKTRSIEVRGSRFCLRGLGDAYTDHYRTIEVPAGCGSFNLTLTHDPAAIEQEELPGLYLAGHTHCGQIKLPYIHPSWAPTSASPEFVCGIGQSDNKVWLTTAGIGTSIIPVRFGAPAAVELITIN